MKNNIFRRRRLTLELGLTLFVLATTALAQAPTARAMAKIPALKLRIGTDLEGVILATEECTRERQHTPCEPEEFAAELNDQGPRTIPEFLLDRYEVSRLEYQQCIRAGRCPALPDSHLPPSFLSAGLPIVNITQAEAKRYCRFRGARLPTEAEYEGAARGPNAHRYPWGNLDHSGRANGGQNSEAHSDSNDGYSLLAPTTAFRAGMSPQGVLQLAGNVAEWTASEFSPHGSSGRPGLIVVKGGSFAEPRIALRATSRRAERSGSRHPDVGFRCAKSINVSLPKTSKD